MNKIKVAIIGGGINSTIGNAHYFSMRLDGGFDIVSGFFSRNSKINVKSAKYLKINSSRVYNNFKELILTEKSNVDFFLVLTPTSSHFEILKFLINQKVNIICEKPIVSDLYEAKIIKKLLRNYSKKFITIFNYTGYPAVREIKEIIKRKKIGRIISFNFKMPQETFVKNNIQSIQKWRLIDKTLPTITQDLTVHLINLIFFIFKTKPKKVISYYSQNFNHLKVKDDCKSILVFSNFSGTIWVSKSALGEKNGLSLEIYGERGSVVWRQSDNENLVISYKTGETKIINRSCKTYEMSKPRYQRYRPGHPSGFIEAFSNYYTDIKNFFMTNKSGYLSNFNDGYQAIEILNYLSLSNKKQKWINIKKKT